MAGPWRTDWKPALDHGYLGKLGWLEYSLKRSLGIECADEEERRMGTEQAVGTLDALSRYAGIVSEVEDWLRNGL